MLIKKGGGIEPYETLATCPILTRCQYLVCNGNYKFESLNKDIELHLAAFQ